VLTSVFLSGIGILYFGKKLLSTNNRFLRIALKTNLNANEGFVSVENTEKSFIGAEGITITPLNPSGKVMIDNEIYVAIAEYGYIEKGVNIKVTRFETGQFYCEKK
jgi:membrane-bound serine protease (ClpP class)